MSLFQSHEWWSVRGNASAHCCVICNVDNEPGMNASNKLVIGGLDGMLRMYHPRRREYKVEDMILEKMLEGPILQLACGRFVSGSRELCLAVLHPNRIVVLLVSAVSSSGSVNYYNTMEAYSHDLQQSAYSMCHGPFSGIQGKDFMCVQSLDGCLSFFEQDSPAFRRALPPQTFLAPGPIMYVPKSDSFCLCDSQMVLQSYRYSVLAAAEENAVFMTGDPATQTTGKKIQADWSLNIGEHPQFVFFDRMIRGQSAGSENYCIVGERHLYYLRENGELHSQKRIENEVMCATVYPVPFSSGQTQDGVFSNLILGTNTGHLMILCETQVIWCTQLDHTPIMVQVADLAGIRGMISTMDEEGLLQVSYLGTDPPPAALVNTEMKEINYSAMELEHQQLLQKIRDSHMDSDTRDAKDPARDKLVISTTASGQCEFVECDEIYKNADITVSDLAQVDGSFLQGKLTVTARMAAPGSSAEKLTFVLDSPSFLVPGQSSFFFSKLSTKSDAKEKEAARASTPLCFTVNFKILTNVLCSSLTARIGCTYYVPNSSDPRSSCCEFEIPLSWVVRPVAPVKSANYKVQFDCSRNPPPLAEVFPELFEQPQGLSTGTVNAANTTNIMTVEFIAGNNFTVTILVSKAAGRVCVQSSEFGALYLVANELCERLSHHHCQTSFQESLPLHDYFSVLADHFSVRRHLQALCTDLVDRSQQYRVIQKRLLLRFKDRANPQPLNNLDVLLTATYESIGQSADTIEEAERALKVVSQHLSACTSLMILLIEQRFGMKEDAAILKNYFMSIGDNATQGWEEIVDFNLSHLLSFGFTQSKSAASATKEMFVGNGGAVLPLIKDTTRLRKRITALIDRVAVGDRLLKPDDDA